MGLAVLAIAAIAVGADGVAADAPPAPEARAAGFAVQVRIPGLKPITHAPVLARGGSATAGGGFATQPDPAIASVLDAETAVDVTAGGEDARGDVTTRAAGVSLLDGLITADGVAVRAAAGAVVGEDARSALRTRVDGLVVAGQPIEARPNRVIVLDGVGDLVIEESVDAAEGPTAARTFAIALHLRIRQEYRGLPPGTEILVGYADAGASTPAPAASAPSGDGPPAVDPSDEIVPPTATSSQSGTTDVPLIDDARRAQLLDGGYMFPVLGATANDFSDDWGAPRATTGFHQGIDVFMPTGTPLLAVQDGTLYNVGWNNLGGRRLWLLDDNGNHFYYAHLSGFSPLAREGARVRRGDVLGFVGTTGDAVGTPPHLHFQVHPGGGAAVPPYPYVLSWLTGVPQPVDVSREVGADPGGATTTGTTKPKPKPTPKPTRPDDEALPFETLPVPTAPAVTAPATTAESPAATAAELPAPPVTAPDVLTDTGTPFAG